VTRPVLRVLIVDNDRTISLTRWFTLSAHVTLYAAWDDFKLRPNALQLVADRFISKRASVVALGRWMHDL
jgi:cellulose biosynthesis protein BcsQ